MNIFLLDWTAGYAIKLNNGTFLSHNDKEWFLEDHVPDPDKLIKGVFIKGGGLLVYAMNNNWYIDENSTVPHKLAQVIELSSPTASRQDFIVARNTAPPSFNTQPTKKWWSWF